MAILGDGLVLDTGGGGTVGLGRDGFVTVIVDWIWFRCCWSACICQCWCSLERVWLIHFEILSRSEQLALVFHIVFGDFSRISENG